MSEQATFFRSFRFRLYPTPEQAERLSQFAGASRFVYNLALEQRRDWWRQFKAQTGRRINWASQCLELTELRSELPWLAAVPRMIIDQAVRDLEKSFTAFFAGGGYPGFRTKEENHAFRAVGRSVRIAALNHKWSNLRIQCCDPIKMRVTRSVIGKIKNAAIRFDGRHWYVAIATEIEGPDQVALGAAVGIDRGISNTLSLSNGDHASMPDLSRAITARRLAQRNLARCSKGSNRRATAKARVARCAARVKAARAHWLHEQSTAIANSFGLVAMEKLNVKNMTASAAGIGRAAKAGLNRSILEQGWSIFAEMLEYKLAERGGQVEYVNPAYTSQTCSDCGSVSADNRKSQAVFDCIDCGHRAHADTNAAINILRRSPAWQRVEGSSCRPVEARTEPALAGETVRLSRGEAEPEARALPLSCRISQ